MSFMTTELQGEAAAFIREHGLDSSSLAQLESRWGVVWSNRWGSGLKAKKRTLYQCACRYNTGARQQRSNMKPSDTSGQLASQEWSRRAAYDFTGCCAHADITCVEATGSIERIEQKHRG